MKKPWIIMLIFLLVIVLGIVISVIITKQREKRINRFEFPSTMIVNNFTTHKYADTIAMVILNKIFDYDTINLNIYYSPKNLSSSEYEIIGFIQQNPFQLHSYNVFVKKGTLPTPIKTFLSHELIHLHQMELGDLIQIDYTKIVYKSDTMYFSQVPYDKRPYEIDAYSRQDGIRKQLNNLLYSK